MSSHVQQAGTDFFRTLGPEECFYRMKVLVWRPQIGPSACHHLFLSLSQAYYWASVRLVSVLFFSKDLSSFLVLCSRSHNHCIYLQERKLRFASTKNSLRNRKLMHWAQENHPESREPTLELFLESKTEDCLHALSVHMSSV